MVWKRHSSGFSASKKNKALVEGKVVKLTPFTNERDRYGRLLKYVWVPYKKSDGSESDLFVNGELVLSGHARVPGYTRGQTLYSSLATMEKLARRDNHGLWEQCNVTVTTLDYREPF